MSVSAPSRASKETRACRTPVPAQTALSLLLGEQGRTVDFKMKRCLLVGFGLLIALFVISPRQAQASAELRNVHIGEDLVQRGCDVWNPFSLQCRGASFLYCRSNGYEGGYGPLEYSGNLAIVACLKAVDADYMEIAYGGSCAFANPSSLSCQNHALEACLNSGYIGAAGVIGANPNVIATMCLKRRSGAKADVVFSSISELQDQNPGVLSCNRDGIIQGSGCQHNVHRFCVSKGFGTGFDVSNFDGVQSGSVVCTRAQTVQTEIQLSAATGLYERPAILGTRLMGGASFCGDVSCLDVIRNAFTYPIVVTETQPFSTYVSATGSGYSADNCFFLNRAAMFQDDTSWDGELMCNYSQEQSKPSMDYGTWGRGVLLNPGERLIYQGSSQWNSGGFGLYSYSTVTFAAVGNYEPVSRIRFPRWDSGYVFPAGQTLTVYAGCGKNCLIKPSAVPPEKVPVGADPTDPRYLQSSNDWYVSPVHTAIKGITIFANTSVEGYLRVVQQGGQNIRPPYHFVIDPVQVGSSLVLGPTAFNQFFGNSQDGSSFVPIDIDVPAGALIGIDFILKSTGDFGGYVWLDRRPM